MTSMNTEGLGLRQTGCDRRPQGLRQGLGERKTGRVRGRLGISNTDNLDSLDKIGCAVGHLLGRLYELALGGRIGGTSRSQAAAVTQCRGVLGHNGGCREHLWRQTRGRATMRAGGKGMTQTGARRLEGEQDLWKSNEERWSHLRSEDLGDRDTQR